MLANLILQSDTDDMHAPNAAPEKGARKAKEPDPNWKGTRTPNLKIYVPSGVYFARLRVKGKLVRQSLETTVRSVAELRLSDLVKEERAMVESGQPRRKGRMKFSDALEMYEESVENNVRTKDSSKHYRQQTIDALVRSWPGIKELDVSKITKAQCESWAGRFSKSCSPTRFNNTLGTLRGVLENAVSTGARYANPAAKVKRMRIRSKPLDLPSIEEFADFVQAIRDGGGWCSEDCADFVEFLAYSGCRKGEAGRVTWADVNFRKGKLRIAGDADTGTKNWDYRTIPMNPALKALLLRMRAKAADEPIDAEICRVKEAQKAMDRAAKTAEIRRLTHHNLRDFFATTCLEQDEPVPVPVLAGWLGHKDGGVLVLKRYVHPRQGFGKEAASKVAFLPKVSSQP